MRNVLIDDPQVSFLKKKIEILESELHYYKNREPAHKLSTLHESVSESAIQDAFPTIALPLYAYGGYESDGHGYQVFAKTQGRNSYVVRFFVSEEKLYADKWTRATLLKELLTDALESLIEHTSVMDK